MKDKIIDLIKKSGLKRIENELIQSIKSSIKVNVLAVNEKDIKIGQSKIGGIPDVPCDFVWPLNKNGDPLAFLAQFNLEKISKYDIEKSLPPSGMLYFFYDAEEQPWGFDPEDRGYWKVLYYESSKNLNRAEFPDNLHEDFRFIACALSFELDFTLPLDDSPIIRVLQLSSKERDLYFDLMMKVLELRKDDYPLNRLLGYPDQIQGEMQLECQLVSNGLYCGNSSGYNDPKAKELEKGASNWKLLFQLDSIDEAGMMWGDCGSLYFWIEEEALKNRDFENVWLILQCY